MKTVIDTNVFVSGLFWKGPPSQILSAWKNGRFKLVVSPSIIAEYRRVLNQLSQKYPNPTIEPILDLVSLNAEMVDPVRFVKQVCTDPNDDQFLEAGFTAKADYIVSGDKALLAVKSFKGSEVVKPAEFLKLIG